MNRRAFQKKLALGIPVIISPTGAFRTKPRIKAKKLRPGDTVGLITPGSYLDDDGLEKAVENMIKLGFKVKMAPNIRAKRGFNAGTDQQRLDDIHLMFSDDSVDAVWCARGGYGCSRLLPYLDYQLIKNNPKALIGYSDVTALLNAIYMKTGLVGFHGPVGASDFTDYTTEHFKALLMQTNKEHQVKPAPANLEKEEAVYHPKTIRSGIAAGELVGGNLSLLAAMAGTGYLPDVRGKIVFIEDIGEKPYRVDRMMTQLRQAWNLKEAAGIAMGVFADCEADEDDLSLTLWETVNDRVKDLGIPAIYGLSFGHIANQCTLPVGAKVRLDVEARSLTIMEAVVE